MKKKIANSQIRPSYHISIVYTSWPPEAIEKSCEGHNQANNLNLQTKTKGGILLRSSVLASVVWSDPIPWISKQLLLCLGFETNKCKTVQNWNDDDAKIFQLIYYQVWAKNWRKVYVIWNVCLSGCTDFSKIQLELVT